MKSLDIFRSIKNKLLILFLFFSSITVLESYYCYTIFREREESVETRELIHRIGKEILQLQYLVYDSRSKQYFQGNQSRYV